MRWILIQLFILFSIASFHVDAADDKTLNVYNWSNYMPPEIIKQFEKETGIHVNYSTFSGNDELYAKLKAAPNAGYDVIVPSNYFVSRMSSQGMLHKLDKSKLSNFKFLNTALLNKPFDSNNQYSLPYFWGTTAIVVNKNYINPSSVQKFSDLWKPEFYNKLLILDDTRDLFSVALMALGYSANDTNLQHVYKAYLKLKDLLPNVRMFNSDAIKVNYIDEDAVVGLGYSGEIYQAWKENPNLVYIYPTDGFIIWIDCIAIPKNAPHIENAYRFINFLMRPDIAEKLSMTLGYASPNSAALKLMPEQIRNNPIIYPSPEIIARGQFEAAPGDLDRVYEKYMEELKISA